MADTVVDGDLIRSRFEPVGQLKSIPRKSHGLDFRVMGSVAVHESGSDLFSQLATRFSGMSLICELLVDG
jgi:hypothetical protein